MGYIASCIFSGFTLKRSFLVVTLKQILDLNLNFVKNFQFVTGIATVNTKSMYYYLQFTMLFVCQKHILIKVYYPRIETWRYQDDLIRADHPANSKQGSVCIYYRNSLPLKTLDIFYLQECIVTFTNNLELILNKFLNQTHS